MEKSPEAFRTISEVSEVLETPAHVLRFWESRFPQVRPVKRAGGRRYYRPSDVALLGGIKRLLHDEGMTIRGVQKILREQGVRHVAGLPDETSLDELALEAALAHRFDEEAGFSSDEDEADLGDSPLYEADIIAFPPPASPPSAAPRPPADESLAEATPETQIYFDGFEPEPEPMMLEPDEDFSDLDQTAAPQAPAPPLSQDVTSEDVTAQIPQVAQDIYETMSLEELEALTNPDAPAPLAVAVAESAPLTEPTLATPEAEPPAVEAIANEEVTPAEPTKVEAAPEVIEVAEVAPEIVSPSETEAPAHVAQSTDAPVPMQAGEEILPSSREEEAPAPLANESRADESFAPPPLAAANSYQTPAVEKNSTPEIGPEKTLAARLRALPEGALWSSKAELSLIAERIKLLRASLSAPRQQR